MSDLDLRRRAVVTQVVAVMPCRDLVRSTAFYERLGFVARPYEDGASYVFLTRDDGAMHLRLLPDAETEQRSAMSVYLYVDDADVLYDELMTAGVPCQGEPADMPWRMREFAVSDPDGSLLRFGHHLP